MELAKITKVFCKKREELLEQLLSEIVSNGIKRTSTNARINSDRSSLVQSAAVGKREAIVRGGKLL